MSSEEDDDWEIVEKQNEDIETYVDEDGIVICQYKKKTKHKAIEVLPKTTNFQPGPMMFDDLHFYDTVINTNMKFTNLFFNKQKMF